jgi:hypothetical protein
MKALTTGEKLGLIRHHGRALASTGDSVRLPLRSDILESAQRILELAKSIPKTEFGIE